MGLLVLFVRIIVPLAVVFLIVRLLLSRRDDSLEKRAEANAREEAFRRKIAEQEAEIRRLRSEMGHQR